MPKKEEILEKNNKVNKEKISKKATVLDESKEVKTEKKAKKEVAKKETKPAAKKTTTKTTKVAKETPKKDKEEKVTKKTAVKEIKTTKKDSNKTKEKASKEPKTTEKVSKTTTKKTTKVAKETPKKDKEEKATKKETKSTSSKKETKKAKAVELSEKVEEKTEKKVDELSVIEKIKSFIAKIAAMQEEARKEAQAESEEVEKKTTRKTKTVKKVKTEKEVKKFEYMLEYYDLPYRYNETVVKILAQTPKRMFVYWDISDNDREKYIKTFGEDFFEKTYPVLLLYNEDKKYIKEIAINDFANSWYIDIPDAKTKYSIQLGRKFKSYNEVVTVNTQKVQENNIILHTDYLPFANSNILEVPNDRILLDSLPRVVTFRNVKTNEERTVELKDIKNVYGIYDVKEFYEEHYKDEISEGMFDMANPSSNLSSSSFK